MSAPEDRYHRLRADDPERPALRTFSPRDSSSLQRDPASAGQLGALLGERLFADREAAADVAAVPVVSSNPAVGATPTLQKPTVM